MTDATKQALEAFVLQIVEAAKTGASWTAEQTPILVQEWLRWQLAESVIWLVIPLFIIIIILSFGWKIIPALVRANAYESSRDEDYTIAQTVGGIISSVIACIIMLVGVFPAIMQLTKVLVAPRVVVFEKFVELIK
jgi:hypothetical protein